MRVAIIGAGISGLALAYYLQKLGVPYDLLEASAVVGGTIRSVKQKDYLFELGPAALQMCPELQEFIQDLKLEHDLIPARPNTSQRYILRAGKLQKLPDTPFALRSHPALSIEAKRRIFQEKSIPPAAIPDETVSHFFERRFGPEAAAYAANLFMPEGYTGDPDKLLIGKALPEIKALETKYGSVLKGLLNQEKEETENFSFVKGLETLPQAIAEKLISLHLNHKVELVTKGQGRFIISCASSSESENEEYDLLVLALPATQAAEIVEFTYPGLAAALLNVTYKPLAVVQSIYHRRDVGAALEGYGASYPKTENTLACSSVWTSSLFEGRCRPHETLFTTFVEDYQPGRQTQQEQQALLHQVHGELCRHYKISARKPVFQHIHFWQQAVPQHDLYIEDAHQMAQQLEQNGLFVAANWQAGVSINDCIRHAKALASKINSKRSGALNS